MEDEYTPKMSSEGINLLNKCPIYKYMEIAIKTTYTNVFNYSKLM